LAVLAVPEVEVLAVEAPVAVLPRTTLRVAQVALMILAAAPEVPADSEVLPGLAEFCRPFFRRV
jgi:hypothetical protein